MEKCCSEQRDATEAILAFDTLYTNNHMKILKLLFPYLNGEHQKKLAVYIKWQELLYTLNFFAKYSSTCFSARHTDGKSPEISVLLPLLTPYCNEKERGLLSQFAGMQNVMSLYSQFQEYMPLIQSMMSSVGESGTIHPSDGSNKDSMMDLLKNMMPEEQLSMFSMFMNGGF